MSNDPADRDFDWVTVRHKCTAREAFPRLQKMAKLNVETRCQQITADVYSAAPPRFEVSDQNPPTFTIQRGIGMNPANDPEVRFGLIDALTIRVDGTGLKEPFDVRVCMDSRGDCILTVDGEELKDWQILHRALDSLLFDDPRNLCH